MTIKRAILIYVVALLVTLPVTFPAALLERFVTLPPNISHSPLSGSVLGVKLDWLQIGPLRLADLEARPALAGLLSGTPLSIVIGKPLPLKAKVGGGGDTLVLAEGHSTTRLETLLQILGLPGVGVDALVDVVVHQAKLVRERCEELDGTLTLSDFNGEDFAQLSEVAATLSCANGNLVVTVLPENTLRLSGSATITPNGRYQVDMTAQPPQGPLFDLFTDFLGQPRDGRSFQIRFRS